MNSQPKVEWLAAIPFLFFLTSFYVFTLARPWGMWDLSSPTRGKPVAPCTGSAVLTTGPSGKSLSNS